MPFSRPCWPMPSDSAVQVMVLSGGSAGSLSPHQTCRSQAAKTGKPFQITDIRMAQAYQDRHPLAVSAVEVAGILAILAVPLVRDGVATGVIVVYRKVPGVFSR